jgi:hypothetical protein
MLSIVAEENRQRRSNQVSNDANNKIDCDTNNAAEQTGGDNNNNNITNVNCLDSMLEDAFACRILEKIELPNCNGHNIQRLIASRASSSSSNRSTNSSNRQAQRYR